MRSILSAFVYPAPSLRRFFAFTAAFGLFSCATWAGTLAKLTITPEKGDLIDRARLSWDAVPGALYVVQSATNVSNSGNNENWNFGSAMIADSTNASIELPATAAAQFFRLAAQPQIFSVEPTFVNSSDSNAVLYILGQFFPSNAIVVINGDVFDTHFELLSATGTRMAVSLTNLPPGTPVLEVLVLDAGSNVVATLPLQQPVIFDTLPTLEQLQGPPTEPPAGPVATLLMPALMKAKEKANRTKAPPFSVSDDYDDGDDEPLAGVAIPKFINIASEAKRAAEKADVGAIRAGIVTAAALRAATGEFQCEETDLAIPGRGLDFVWTRTYRSRTGPQTAQGAGWDFSYNVSVELQQNGTVVLRPGNGRADTFYPNGTNGWARDEYFVEIRDLDQDGYPDVVVFADTGKWVFNPPGSSAPGKLSQIVDRNGNTISLYYDNQQQCDLIVDTLGRTNVIAYSALSGQIESVTDFSGRTVRYEYDGNGDLVAVVSPSVTGTPNGNDFPGGKTNRYSYTSGNADARLNHNLASCTDPSGQRWLQIFYRPQSDPANFEFDTVNGVLRGPGPFVHLRRYPQTPSPTNGFATVKAILRDAVGNVTEEFYDSRGRCVRLLGYTGRAPFLGQPTTEIDNRPVNKLRADDPDFFETQWTWNPDSLCTSSTTALGDGSGRIDKAEMFFSRTVEPATTSPRKKGDLRVLRQHSNSGTVDTDGDGVGDTSERAWHFDYDPDFGSGPAHKYTEWGPGKLTYDDLHVTFLKGQQGDDWNVGDWAIFNGTAWEKVDNSDMRTRINELETILKNFGLLGRFAAGPRQTTSQDGSFSHGLAKSRGRNPAPTQVMALDSDAVTRASGGFVTSFTDPRGIVTLASHDESGNCTEVRSAEYFLDPQNKPRITMAYNSFGQLTAITNAADANGRRSVTRFVYGDDPFTVPVEPAVPFAFMVVEDDDAGGLQITNRFGYDARGNLIRSIDPLGNDWLYTWNALDQCVRVESPTNIITRCVTDFTYDANDNVTRIETEVRDETDTLREGHVVAIGHDFVDRVVSVTEQVSTNQFVTNRFEYDANNQLTAVHSPLAVSGVDPQNYVAFEYDERGLLFREIGAPGSGLSRTNEWSYDGKGRVIGHHQNALFNAHYYSYDGFGRAVAMTDALSNVVACVCDRNDNLVLTRVYGELNDGPGSGGNIRLSEWRGKYDALDRLIESRDSFFDPATQSPIGDGVALTTFTYAPNGNCLTVTDDNGHSTSYGYDTAGRLSSVAGPSVKTTFAILRDRSGNVTSCTQSDRSDLPGPSQVFQEFFAYDSLNRRVADWDNVGNTNRYAYDSRDNLVRYTDPRGAITRCEYDGLSRKTKTFQDMNDNDILEATDVVVTQTWDANSRLSSVTDDNTNTTYYTFNWMDCIVSITSPDGTPHTFVWNTRGNLIQEQDANGTVISNSFDPLNRCVRRDITPGPTVAATTTFETFGYDGLSQLVAASNNVSITIQLRDSFGNRVSSTQDGRTTTYTHDGVGNCLSMTYPSGRVVTYAYDALDQVASVSSSAGGPPAVLAQYAYDGPGRVATIIRANGVGTRLNWNGTVNPANAADDFGSRQVRRVNHQVTGGGAVIDQRIAAFDRNQNRVRRAQTLAFSPVNEPVTNTWSHDALDRATQNTLFRANSVASKSYTVDGNGNRQMVLSNGVAQFYTMDATPLPGPADFQMDQYSTTPFGSQTYDENGNLGTRTTSAAQLVYQYDYANRLVSVADLFTGAPVPVASFEYDALGRRISKTVYPPVPLAPVTTEYIRDVAMGEVCDDGGEILEERTDGILSATYIHGSSPGGTARYTGDSHICTAARYTADSSICTAARLVCEIRDGQTHFYHSDDLGNVLALTDASGNVIERYDYDDFGLPEFLTSDGFPMATNASPVGNPFLFHGMEWDRETELYFSKRDGTPVIEWTFEKGWPCRYEGPRLDYYDAKTGRGVCATVRVEIKQEAVLTRNGFAANLWSGGGEGAGASRLPRNILKSYFQTGDKPTAPQFSALLDSMVNRSAVGNGSAGLFLSRGTRASFGSGGGGGGAGYAYQCCEYHRRQKSGHVTLLK